MHALLLNPNGNTKSVNSVRNSLDATSFSNRFQFRNDVVGTRSVSTSRKWKVDGCAKIRKHAPFIWVGFVHFFCCWCCQIFANFYCTFKITDSLNKFWKKLGYFYSSIWSHCPHPFPVSSKNVLKPVSGEDDDDDTVNFFHTSSSGTGKSEIPEMSFPPPSRLSG